MLTRKLSDHLGIYNFELVIVFETLSIKKCKNLITLALNFSKQFPSETNIRFFVSENHIGFYGNFKDEYQLNNILIDLFKVFKFNTIEIWPSQILQIIALYNGKKIKELNKLKCLEDYCNDNKIFIDSYSGYSVKTANQLKLYENFPYFFIPKQQKLYITIKPNNLYTCNIIYTNKIQILFDDQALELILIDKNTYMLPNKFLDFALKEHQSLEVISEKKYYLWIPKMMNLKDFVLTLGLMIHSHCQDLALLCENYDKNFSNLENKLHMIEFYPGLGNMYNKKMRILQMSKKFFPENHLLHIATNYLYNDLTTKIVQEFPELEGIASQVYLANMPEIGTIIADSLWPLNYSDERNPSTLHPTGLLLGFIKRLDSLIQFASLNLLPNGSRDPLNIRRLTYAIIRIGFFLKPSFDLVTTLFNLNNLKEYLNKRIINYLNSDAVLVSAILQANTSIWTAEERLAALLKVNYNKIANSFKRMEKFINKDICCSSTVFHIEEVVAISDEIQEFIDNTYIENPDRKEENIKRLNMLYAKLKTFVNFYKVKG